MIVYVWWTMRYFYIMFAINGWCMPAILFSMTVLLRQLQRYVLI